MNETHVALISIKSFSNDGISLLKKVTQDLSQRMDFNRLSSVYKIEGETRSPQHVHDLKKVSSFDGLSVVAMVETTADAKSLIEDLVAVQARHESLGEHRSVSLNLLSYDDRTIMMADLTLPYPEFHLKPELLFPAVEIWPEYIHPVLNETLKNLTKRFANLRWGEFHSQGKSLLDFSC